MYLMFSPARSEFFDTYTGHPPREAWNLIILATWTKFCGEDGSQHDSNHIQCPSCGAPNPRATATPCPTPAVSSRPAHPTPGPSHPSSRPLPPQQIRLDTRIRVGLRIINPINEPFLINIQFLQSHLPLLIKHLLKFLRWLDKVHLHGESDLIYQLNQYQDAVQGPNEEPTAFYSRLTTLSYAAQTTIGHKDFLARLTPS